jgi:hypothetical protein
MAMCIVAYGAVSANARSFNAQLVCREERELQVLYMRGEVWLDPSKHEQMSAQSIFNPVKFNSVDK